MISSPSLNPKFVVNRSLQSPPTAMPGSVDDLGGGFEGPPPDSWEVADLDATMSRLMLSSKRECNNSSPNLTTMSPSLSEFTSASSAPARSSSGGVWEDMVNSVDQFLREALQNPRERLSVLRMEQDVEKFMRDPSQQEMEFSNLPTSYLRLAAHRVAHHYSLQSMVLLDNNLPDASGSRIIIRKTSESHLPLIRLADIPIKLPTDDSTSNIIKVAIKQRPNKISQLIGENSSSLRSNSLKSVEERKEEYNRARARIFYSSSSSSTSSGSLEVSSSTGVDLNSGRGLIDSTTGRSRIEETIGRSKGSNSRVAIFRDREVERNDPDYDRSYDRYAQRFDPGFGFNGGSYPIQPMYAPVLNYNTEFPQLGSAHTHPSEHQHLPGPWVAPSSPTGYRPQETMVPPFSPNHAAAHSTSTLYMHYPSQPSAMTFIHPRQHLAQSQQQQSDASFGLARPR